MHFAFSTYKPHLSMRMTRPCFGPSVQSCSQLANHRTAGCWRWPDAAAAVAWPPCRYGHRASGDDGPLSGGGGDSGGAMTFCRCLRRGLPQLRRQPAPKGCCGLRDRGRCCCRAAPGNSGPSGCESRRCLETVWEQQKPVRDGLLGGERCERCTGTCRYAASGKYHGSIHFKMLGVWRLTAAVSVGHSVRLAGGVVAVADGLDLARLEVV